MKKAEFCLQDEDFNYIVEISSNDQSIMQIVDGKPVLLSMADRADRFWNSVADKYGFVPGTVVTDIKNRDSRFFAAVPLKEGSNDVYCHHCKNISGPDSHSGCNNAYHPDCAWHIKK